MRRQPPQLSNLADYALFLDVDGTLADIAARPALAEVAPETLASLAILSSRMNGAVAIISGRKLDEVDALMGSQKFAAAGIHGAELRGADGTVTVDHALAPTVGELEAALRGGIGSADGIIVERKPVSVAVHYRENPALHDEIHELAVQLVRSRPQFKLMTGKMIVEILPARVDKGAAIWALMQSAPFAGRTPVFAGDDVTDEDGFSVVRGMSGISIKIGDGPSKAEWGFPTAACFREWLRHLSLGTTGNSTA